MNNVAMWGMIIGFISANFVIPLIQQPKWSTPLRALVTFIYSVVVAVANAFFAGELNLTDWVTSMLLILVTAITTYHGFAKKVGIAPIIENATSGSSLPSV